MNYLDGEEYDRYTYEYDEHGNLIRECRNYSFDGKTEIFYEYVAVEVTPERARELRKNRDDYIKDFRLGIPG